MKRQRGRGRKPGGGGHHHHQGGGHQHPNRTMESNGPEGKVRGPAALIYERYLQMARDAQSSGDRVTAENFLQHAEHYFRLLRQMQPAAPPPSMERFGGDQDYDAEEGGSAEAEGGENEAADAEGEQPDAEFPAGQRPPQQNFEGGDDGGFRRRRGRRNRFRPDGDRPDGERAEGEFEGGEQRAERGERPERPERAERADRAERPERAERPDRAERPERPERAERQRRPREERPQEEAEGFSNGPRPAFLRSD